MAAFPFLTCCCILVFFLPIACAELQYWQRAVSACSGYVLGTLVTCPMDVLKTRLQAPPLLGSAISSGQLLRQMIRQEGPLSLYRGFGAAMLMAPSMILQYSLYDELRKSLSPVSSAVIAGVLDITLKTPFERLKTQLQSNSGKAQAGLVLPSLAQDVRRHGLSHLWQGYTATLMRDIPYVVFYWSSYDALRDVLGIEQEEQTLLRGVKSFVGGALAGAFAATLVTPADVIKTQVQVSSHGSNREAFRAVMERGGLRALFSGLQPRLLRIPLYTGVTLATFETLKAAFAMHTANKTTR